MWVMLIKKLPTAPSPPKLSIFWSTPWPDYPYGPPPEDDDERLGLYDQRLEREQWAAARKIRYCGEDLRIFPREFSAVSHENLTTYLTTPGLYTLRSTDVAHDMLIAKVLEGDDKLVFDAAKVDGCNDAQAMLVALGMDVTMPDAEFPPIGWYQCAKEYAEVFCHDWEMKEETITERELIASGRAKTRLQARQVGLIRRRRR